MPDLIESVNGHAPQQIGVNLAAGVLLVGSRLSLLSLLGGNVHALHQRAHMRAAHCTTGPG